VVQHPGAGHDYEEPPEEIAKMLLALIESGGRILDKKSGE